ncbi:MAG TPA: hypothetical protein VFP58_07460 [Candidatus Eisenbacteria bacterium]|nr:hypothetical protein [Candidatus Eisenbacteria bacterium]
MRVLVSRRVIGLSLLLAMLCMMPAVSPPVFAKPIGWENFPDPDAPDGPKGDGDGVVVKAGSIQVDRTATTSTTKVSGGSVWSSMLEYLRMMWLGYGSRLYW